MHEPAIKSLNTAWRRLRNVKLHECQDTCPKTRSFYIYSSSTINTQGGSAIKAASDTQDMIVIDTDTYQKASVKCPSIDTPGILVDLLTSVRVLHQRAREWCSLYLIDE